VLELSALCTGEAAVSVQKNSGGIRLRASHVFASQSLLGLYSGERQKCFSGQSPLPHLYELLLIFK